MSWEIYCCHIFLFTLNTFALVCMCTRVNFNFIRPLHFFSHPKRKQIQHGSEIMGTESTKLYLPFSFSFSFSRQTIYYTYTSIPVTFGTLVNDNDICVQHLDSDTKMKIQQRTEWNGIELNSCAVFMLMLQVTISKQTNKQT